MSTSNTEIFDFLDKNDIVQAKAFRCLWIGIPLLVISYAWFFLATRIFAFTQVSWMTRILASIWIAIELWILNTLLTRWGYLLDYSSHYSEYPQLFEKRIAELVAILFALSICSLPLAAIPRAISRRMVVPTLPIQKAASSRRILYLRSFVDDTSVLREAWLAIKAAVSQGKLDHAVWGSDDRPMGETPEEWLTSIFTKFGNVIAIGRPGERFTPLGASRIYVGDNWQHVVTKLIDSSELVIIRLGPTSGVWWEVDTAIQMTPPKRLLFQLPERRWFSTRRKKVYKEFRTRMAKQNVVLPRSCGYAQFIWFNDEGAPVLLRPSWYRIVFSFLLSRENNLKSSLQSVLDFLERH